MFDSMTQQADPRQSQRANRNASSFNIISFDPNTANQNDFDRQQKRDRQNAYKDQLDQMQHLKKSTPPVFDNYGRPARNPSSDKPQSWGGEPGAYQAAPQYDQRAPNDYAAKSYNDYALDQHATDIQKNYNLGGGYSEYQREQLKAQNRYVTELPGTNTFETQDKQRGQLLDRIRSGYNNQNFNVYNAYQRAHEQREHDRQDFERNVIDKAAREKLIKEQEAAMKDWDRKKRLQQEMSDANRRAIDAKSSQKRREKEKEDFIDQQRNQDALAAHKRSEFLERERNKRMIEETNQSLSKQVHDHESQKQRHGKEISPSRYKIGWDSIDNLAGSRNLDNQSLRNNQQVSQDPYLNRGGEQRQPQYDDQSYGGLNAGGQQRGYQDDPYARGYDQPSDRNAGYGQAGSSNDYSRIKDKFRHGSGFNIITNEYR